MALYLNRKSLSARAYKKKQKLVRTYQVKDRKFSPEVQDSHQKASQEAIGCVSVARCIPAQFHTCFQIIQSNALNLRNYRCFGKISLWIKNLATNIIPGFFSSNLGVTEYFCSCTSFVRGNWFSSRSVGITHNLMVQIRIDNLIPLR